MYSIFTIFKTELSLVGFSEIPWLFRSYTMCSLKIIFITKKINDSQREREEI